MARKRGGLAGIWDRNKQIIKPVASGLAGLLGTPALGAAVGAAMGGLDREGKGGIGFDLKQGAMGGLAGYGAGQIGSGIGSLASKAGLNIGQGSLSRLNTGGGKLANMFLGKPPVAPIPATSTIGAVPPPAPTTPLPPTPAPQGALNMPKVGQSFAMAPTPAPQGALPMPSMGNVGAGLSLPSNLGNIAPNMDKSSRLSDLWSAIKPTAGKDGGNLGMWEKGLGAASDVLTGKSRAESAQSEAERRLIEARTRQMEWEQEQEKKKAENMQRLRDILSQSIPDFSYQPPPWASGR